MFQELLQNLQGINALGNAVLMINVLLILVAPYIVKMIYHEAPDSAGFIRKVRILRALNLLIIFTVLVSFFSIHLTNGNEKNWLMKGMGVLVIIYLAFLSSHIASYFVTQYYGREKEIEGEKTRIPNYQSRLISIFISIFVTIIALISIVQLIEQDNLLKAGGVIGFIGVFFALTQSTWAPDIFSGLIILNSNMLEEGDVVEINDGEKIYGVVYKTRVFHTVILNIVNNHRIMIRNARLREFTVHNLSKFSSAKGLREMLSFKIGYDVPADKVRKLFNDAFATVCEDADIAFETQHCFEIGVHETSDHAVEWRVFYFTKAVDKLPRTRQQILEVILDASIEHGISLSTPLTHIVENNSSQSA